ncbi:MAG: hypothetical protein FJ215_06915 [Ignavibacteria bacterium]|nr:hypothetical protein [Ignavibacteria bacterium]
MKSLLEFIKTEFYPLLIRERIVPVVIGVLLALAAYDLLSPINFFAARLYEYAAFGEIRPGFILGGELMQLAVVLLKGAIVVLLIAWYLKHKYPVEKD